MMVMVIPPDCRKIWTFTQYINLTRVPIQFRSLFGSLIALIWSIYIAATQSS